MTRTPKAAAGDASPPQLRLDNQLCFALYAATNALTRLYQPQLRELGVTYPQYLVLLVLWEHAPCTVGELGQALDLDSGTLTPLLKRMESAGLVTRRRDVSDERRVIVSLTAAGRHLRIRAEAVPGQLSRSVGIPLDEARALREQLKRLRAAIAAS
jgi:DNA-binding MarR family transcriptional regulator